MKIRKITERDLPACTKIIEEAYGRPPYNEVFKKFTAKKYIKGKFVNCRKNSFVVIDSSVLVAFIFLNVSAWSDGVQAILEEVVVSPSYQGAGIGKELLQYVHNYLQSLGAKSVMLWAKKDKRLLNFYKKQGYFIANDFAVMFKNFS